MTPPFLSAAAIGIAACMASFVSSANGAVLIADSYDVSTNSANVNFEIESRQSGTLAPVSYFERSGPTGFSDQVGNPSDFPGSPGALLITQSGGAYLNYDLAAAGTPLLITVSGLISDYVNATDLQQWIGLTIADQVETFEWITGADFGVLFRATGETQYFVNGLAAAGSSASSPAPFDTWHTYSLLLADTAGTGSAFSGNGSRVTFFKDGEELDRVDLPQLTHGYLGLVGYREAGFDHLLVESVPEPGWFLPMSLAGLLGMVRRRRAGN